MRGRWAIAMLLLGLACASPAPLEGGLPPGAFQEEVLAGGVSDARALVRLSGDFYQRLEGRRFDSIATYQDPALREYFETKESFADYYADLAQILDQSYFEASRPTAVVVEALAVDGPGRARVRVRITGENRRPLRWWQVHVIREDRWERRSDRWWIIPGKL